MITKKYLEGAEAREAIQEVAGKIGRTIGNTLGPSGRNYFIPSGITNDGATILNNIRFEDECKDSIALAFGEIAIRADKEGGDGTTTATVIGTQLAIDVLEKVQDLRTPTPGGIPVMQLARQLEEEKDKVIALLEEKAMPTDTLEKLEHVAMTAMEDEEGAKIVAEAIWEAGKKTFPVLDNGLNGKIEKDVIDGVSYPFEIANQSFYNRGGRKEAEYENVAILVVNHAFEEYTELSNFMLSLVADKPKIGALVIVANNFSMPFLSHISELKEKMGFVILPVQRKNMHNDTYEDLASLVDAKFTDTHPKTGNKIADVVFKDAGLAKKVIAREKETLFIGGRGKDALVRGGKAYQTRIQKRVGDLKTQMDTEKDEKEKEQLEKRMAALEGGIATIYVDAQTAAEKYYLKLKVEDAMNSCRNALQEGMVKGGGVALWEIANSSGLGGGDALMFKALLAPFNRIQQNHGEKLEIGENVLDSLTVLKSAVKNAVSVTKLLISCEGIVANVEPSMVEELKSKLME